MLIFDETVCKTTIDEWDSLAAGYGRENVLMFDLETTGLSPRNAFIYIIGINLWKDGEWHILQLYNDDGRSEPAMLTHFMELLSGKTTLFHFNGDSFDIPFVRGRMDKIRQSLGQVIPDKISPLASVDFLKLIRPYKYALGLPNVRQKTVEQYLGIYREDQYNGGQLIDVYLSGLTSGSLRNRELVLLHNRDDMEGMFHLARMHALTALNSGEYAIDGMTTAEKGNLLYLELKLQLSHTLPAEIVTTGFGAVLSGAKKEGCLRLPLTQMEAVSCITREPSPGFYLPCAGYTGVPVYESPENKRITCIAADDQLLGDPARLHAYSLCCIQSLMKPPKR